MRHLHKRKLLEYLAAIIFIISIFYLGSRIGYAPMIEFMKANLLLGIFIYFIYSIVSNVIIFLPLVPLWPIIAYLYGFNLTIIITIIGTLIGAAICFFLAKFFGKKFVIKMMGKHLFGEVEHVSQFKSKKGFLFIRLFGNNYYDIVSYMAGLSKLNFQSYMIITTISTVIWIGILFYLIKITGGLQNFSSFLDLMTIYAVIVLIGTFAWEIFHKKHYH